MEFLYMVGAVFGIFVAGLIGKVVIENFDGIIEFIGYAIVGILVIVVAIWLASLFF